jgi:hypothetical protein
MSGMKSKRVVQAYRRFGDEGGLSIDDASQLLLGGLAPNGDEAVTAAPAGQDWADVKPRGGVEVRQTLLPWEEFGPGASRGATFATRDEAARAALDATNNWSRDVNAEYRWLIYKDENGHYRYTPPEYGGLAGGQDIHMQAPGRVVGMGHTHGNYSDDAGNVVQRLDDQFDSDHFSQRRRGDDYGYMRRHKDKFEAFYLGTPSGQYFQWTPKGGERKF